MGGLDREEKTRRIDSFKRGEADILISTDTGAEGLNFQFLSYTGLLQIFIELRKN